MRKFIISDLHGNGNIYKSIMSYLENINLEEDVVLYINGDLIDRGIESGEMLLDVIDRCKNGPFKIIYLGGNHELMMYQTFLKRIKGMPTNNDAWFDNGGSLTDYYLEDSCSKDEELKIVDFISNLKIYHKFNEKIDGKNIVLVHAASPVNINEDCSLRIKDNELIEYYVWAREDDPNIPFRCRIGNSKYFTIIGHTPVNNKYGYEYNEGQNYLNIDGGCAGYVSGLFEYDHTPLVEVCDDYLKILTFNNNNEIIYGNYFYNKKSFSIPDDELEKDRSYLNKKVKVKKLIKLPDGVIGYEDWI